MTVLSALYQPRRAALRVKLTHQKAILMTLYSYLVNFSNRYGSTFPFSF